MSPDSKDVCTDINPFNGRIVLEIIQDDVEGYLKEQNGLSRDSKLLLPENIIKNKYVPCNKGKVLKKAPDAFGKAYKDRYGDAITYPDVGDTVVFIAMQSYPLDIEKKYHLIADSDILAFYKNKD